MTGKPLISKKKKSLYLDQVLFKPGTSVVNFIGRCAGSGGHHDPHAQPGHPALDHLSNQQTGKSPSTQQLLYRMQSIAEPALTLDLLAFQFLLEKTSDSLIPTHIPSPALTQRGRQVCGRSHAITRSASPGGWGGGRGQPLHSCG